MSGLWVTGKLSTFLGTQSIFYRYSLCTCIKYLGKYTWESVSRKEKYMQQIKQSRFTLYELRSYFRIIENSDEYSIRSTNKRIIWSLKNKSWIYIFEKRKQNIISCMKKSGICHQAYKFWIYKFPKFTTKYNLDFNTSMILTTHMFLF